MREFEDRHVDARDEQTSAGITDLSQNKTLYIGQFQKDVYEPDLLVDVKTMDDVFKKWQPSVEIPFKDENGAEVLETLELEKMKNFEVSNGKDGMTEKSSTLKTIKAEIENAGRMEKSITEDRALRDVLRTSEDKENLRIVLQTMLDELNATIKK